MAASQFLADAILNWLKGDPFPDAPPKGAFLSLHVGEPGHDGTGYDVTLEMAAGRATLPRELIGPIFSMPEGGRQVRNDEELLFEGLASRDASITHVGFWSAPIGGEFYCGGPLISHTEPVPVFDPLEVLEGDQIAIPFPKLKLAVAGYIIPQGPVLTVELVDPGEGWGPGSPTGPLPGDGGSGDGVVIIIERGPDGEPIGGTVDFPDGQGDGYEPGDLIIVDGATFRVTSLGEYVPPFEPVEILGGISTDPRDLVADTINGQNVYILLGATRTTALSSLDNGPDPLVVKYNVETGSIIWQRRLAMESFSTENSDYESSGAGIDIGIDSSGNTYSLVSHAGPSLPAGYLLYLIKISPSGAELWRRSITDLELSGIPRLAVDENGNSYVSGVAVRNPERIGTGLNFDHKIVKFNASGVPVWAIILPQTTIDDLAVNTLANRLYATGLCSSFESQPGGIFPSPSQNYNTPITLAFNLSEGQLLWQVPFGNSTSSTVNDGSPGMYNISTDSSGNVYVTGRAGRLGVPSWFDSPFIVKHSFSGEVLWSAVLGNPPGLLAFSRVVVDELGNVFVGTQNASVVHMFNESGLHQWSKVFSFTGESGATNNTPALCVLNDGKYCAVSMIRTSIFLHRTAIGAFLPDGSDDLSGIAPPYNYADFPVEEILYNVVTRWGMPFYGIPLDEENPINEIVPLPTGSSGSSAGQFVFGPGNIEILVELPTISLAGPVSLLEGNNGVQPFSFSVTRTNGFLFMNSTVNWAVSGTGEPDSADQNDFADNMFPSGSVTFNSLVPTGSPNLPQTITVNVQGDTEVEQDEQFLVALSDPVNAIIGNGQAVGTIINNDFPAPEALAGEAQTGPQISLTWSAVEGAGGYVVQFSIDNGATYQFLANILSPTTSYIHDSLGYDFVYWYRVAAVDAFFAPSTFSDPISVATPEDPNPPASPENAIPAVYTQSSVYVENVAASQANMQNGIANETLQTGTDSDNQFDDRDWVQMDFGEEVAFGSVVIGADLDSTLAGGWGPFYTENCSVRASNVGGNNPADWTTIVASTGTFAAGIQAYPTPGASYRYVRLVGQEFDYLAVTELYAVP